MHVSLQSKIYCGVCVAAGAYNAYSKPAGWITFFAIGVLIGAIEGRIYSNFIADTSKNTIKDRLEKKEYIQTSVPNIIDIVIQLATVVLISQTIKVPPRVATFLEGIPCGAAYILGAVAVNLVHLEFLRRKPDPYIQELLRPIVL
jgi:hypothetical protein